MDDRYSTQVKRMTQATQVLSKTAKDTGDSLQKALKVKDSAQRAAGNLQSVTRGSGRAQRRQAVLYHC